MSIAPVPIVHSSVPGSIPGIGVMTPGSLAVNVVDGFLYTMDYAGVIRRIEGTAVAVDSIALNKLVNVATATILGRNTAGTGSVEALTAAQAKTVLGLTNAELNTNRDVSGGYPALTLFKLNLRNAANTITSWFTTAATVARTWTMPDKDGTVAMTSDLPTLSSLGAAGANNPVLTGLVECNGSRLFGSQVLVMTALNTPQSFPSTGANSGLLRIRDNTLGGGALYLVDPNGGVQLLGTSQISGLSISNGGGVLGYIWQATITSGTVPRNLSWTMYG